MQSEKHPSLYERLGGVDAIANITDDLVERITVDPLLKPYFSIDRPGSRYLLTEMICSRAGGPQRFTGKFVPGWPDCSRMTPREWESFLNDCRQSFDKFNVAATDQSELQAILERARSETTSGSSDDRPELVKEIVEVVPSAIYVMDIRERKLVFFNRDIRSGKNVRDPEFIRSQLHPNDWQPFLDHIERLAKLGNRETADFEYRTRYEGVWRWFHSRHRVFRRDEDGSVREIVGTATDATERKAAEERARFMADLNQAMHPLADPEEIMAFAVRMLGEYLGVDRCGYAEVEADNDHFVVLGNYTRGSAPSIVGRFRMSDFGDRERQVLLQNRAYVVNDIVAESPPGTDLSLYELGGIRSMVCVPLTKEGRFVARMAVHQTTPRNWTHEEIDLLTKVANQCWEVVERARAVRQLKSSDDRYRAFIANSSEAIWRYELEQPIPLALPVDEQIEMLLKHGYLAECNDAMARMYGYETADQIVGARIGDLLVFDDPQNIALLRAFKESDYSLTDFESRELDRHGNTKYFMNNLTAIRENGVLVRGWGTQRDVTEQKRAAEGLRASEERLRRITTATQDALWEIDLKTNQLWWSEGARPLFGRSPSELEIGLQDWYAGIHPEDMVRVHTKFEVFLHDETDDWVDEYRFLRADGSYIYIYDQGSKFRDESGTIARIAGAMVDITKRKVAETALRESEERYRLLTELSPDGVVLTDMDGMIRLANPSMLRMLGTSQEGVIGRRLFDFIAPEYLDHCQDCMRTLLADGKPASQVEAAFLNAEHQSFPVEVNAIRLDWKGQPFAQIVIHDISAHKRAEAERQRLTAEIQAERDRLRQILEQMPIGVAIAEAPNGRLIFHNLEAERLLRHSLLPSDDFNGYLQYGALHEDGTPYRPEEHPAARSLMFREVVKGEEMRYRRGDGTETFFSIDSAPIYDALGQIVLAVVTFIDIGERRLAEQALRESEERFAKAFRASPDSLVISRIADGVVLEVNESFVAMTGYERDEIIGKSTISLGLYANPEDRDRAVKVLKEQNRVRELEISLKRKSGEVVPMMFSAEPFELHGEHCWLTIGHDISERKQAEEERERLLAKEKTAREEAESANRMKDDFLATISHELRTPLTSILGWAHMLSSTSLAESQKRYALEVIERSAKSQRQLIDDILDTSLVITGRLKLDARLVDIGQVFQAAIDVVSPSAEAKQIDLKVVIEDQGIQVFGDANRLQQAIWNMLSNAIKFTNQRGRVKASLARVGGQVEITVSDTGAGIDPRFLPYVFDRFRQADSSSTRKFGGLGLGLAIVRHVVEMHGGSVSASSPGEGKGSTFSARLPEASPVQAGQMEKQPGSSETKKHKLDGKRVLMVEDDRDTLDLLRYILERSGATVAIAASTKEALEVLERWEPHVLLSDLAMPEQDGYELIAKVRSREHGGNLPAVALTAYARAEDRARALASGFQKHVSKPVDPEELIAVVASLAPAAGS